MSGPERIAVFHSGGAGFGRLLRAVRARHPGAHVVAILPHGVDLPASDRAHASETLVIGRIGYPVWDLAGHAALARAVREGRFDLFITRFDSLKQRMLIAVAGATRGECWRIDGLILPMRVTAAGSMTEVLRHRARGAALLVRVWTSILLRPTGRRG